MTNDDSLRSAGMLSDLAEFLDGISTADNSPPHPPGLRRDIFAVRKRSRWNSADESRCNFELRPRLTHRAGIWFLSLWQKSLMGRTLSEIKSDPAEVSHFADAVSDFLLDVMGASLHSGGWCVVTAPKRRHKEKNFATMVSMRLADRLNIPFYEDAALCSSRHRVGAVFSLGQMPKEPNIIVFDDIVTTGSTLKAMSQLLRPLNKNTLFVTGINNN